VLIKVTSKPGLVYERDLQNEIATLAKVNEALPGSPYFPVLSEHGRLPDGRAFVMMTCFDEWPLTTTIGVERTPVKHVAHLITMIEIARAMAALHRLGICHVDLNPMNILCRWEATRPVVRIVDFESSYDVARHAGADPYHPPTTSGYTAPELLRQPPDARADVFSLGMVLCTMLGGLERTWGIDIGEWLDADPEVSPELKEILVTAVSVAPDRRFQSVAAFRAALATYLERIWPGRLWYEPLDA
jgi:serine/threonine protein kinase